MAIVGLALVITILRPITVTSWLFVKDNTRNQNDNINSHKKKTGQRKHSTKMKQFERLKRAERGQRKNKAPSRRKLARAKKKSCLRYQRNVCTACCVSKPQLSPRCFRRGRQR